MKQAMPKQKAQCLSTFMFRDVQNYSIYVIQHFDKQITTMSKNMLRISTNPFVNAGFGLDVTQ